VLQLLTFLDYLWYNLPKMNTKRKLIILLLLMIPSLCWFKVILYHLSAMGPLDIYLVKRMNYNARGMYHELAHSYEKLVAKHPEHTDLLYLLGWAYYNTGRAHEGYECMKKYAESNPYYPKWQDYYIEKVRKAAENAL